MGIRIDSLRPSDARHGVQRLGATDLLVTSVGIGCSEIGHILRSARSAKSEDEARTLIRTALTSPFNLVDTAAIYGDGWSEAVIGAVLKEFGSVPEGYVVATKADRDRGTGVLTGDQVRRSIDQSLHRLGLDFLQLVYLHDPERCETTFTQLMGPGGAVDTLHRLREQGLIGHIGVASGPIEVLAHFVSTGAFEVALTHNRFTLLDQSAAPFLQLAASHGVAVVNAAPYGGGLLAKGPDAWPKYMYQPATPGYLERARRLQDLCRQFDIPLAAVALQWSVRQPLIDLTIVGMSSAVRVHETVQLLAEEVPEALWTEVLLELGTPLPG